MPCFNTIRDGNTPPEKKVPGGLPLPTLINKWPLRATLLKTRFPHPPKTGTFRHALLSPFKYQTSFLLHSWVCGSTRAKTTSRPVCAPAEPTHQRKIKVKISGNRIVVAITCAQKKVRAPNATTSLSPAHPPLPLRGSPFHPSVASNGRVPFTYQSSFSKDVRGSVGSRAKKRCALDEPPRTPSLISFPRPPKNPQLSGSRTCPLFKTSPLF